MIKRTRQALQSFKAASAEAKSIAAPELEEARRRSRVADEVRTQIRRSNLILGSREDPTGVMPTDQARLMSSEAGAAFNSITTGSHETVAPLPPLVGPRMRAGANGAPATELTPQEPAVGPSAGEQIQ